jgi:hypothetical protein
MEVRGELHAPADLFQGKENPVPTAKETGWDQKHSGLLTMKNFLAPEEK